MFFSLKQFIILSVCISWFMIFSISKKEINQSNPSMNSSMNPSMNPSNQTNLSAPIKLKQPLGAQIFDYVFSLKTFLIPIIFNMVINKLFF